MLHLFGNYGCYSFLVCALHVPVSGKDIGSICTLSGLAITELEQRVRCLVHCVHVCPHVSHWAYGCWCCAGEAYGVATVVGL